MKKFQKTIMPFLLAAFVSASALLCCYKPASASMTKVQPSCHQSQPNKSQAPAHNHSCCQKNMMMQAAVVNQDILKEASLVKSSDVLLVLALDPTVALAQGISHYRYPMSPQEHSSIPVYLKTHTLRL